MQYQFSGADSDCFIMGRSLCQCLSLMVKVSSSGIFHGQMQVSWVRRGNSTQAPVFLTVYVKPFMCKLS